MVCMIKPASSACNADCDYCFYRASAARRAAGERGIMSLDTLQSLLAALAESGDKNISLIFQGGEPTLAGLDFYRALIETERRYPQICFDNALQTNGLLLDESWARFLAQNDFLVGLSLDGDAQTHRLHRADFDRVYAAAKLLQKRRVTFNILTVVTDALAQSAARIYGFYKQNGFLRQQYIPALPCENALLTAENYGRFLITLFDLWYADIMAGSEVTVSYFDDLAALCAGYLPGSCGRMGVCSPQYVIESDGAAYPCDFYCEDGFCLGNILTDRLRDIEKNRAKLGFITDSLKLPAACEHCDCFGLCRGGCRRNRDENNLNRYCGAYRVFLRHAAPLLKNILTAKEII